MKRNLLIGAMFLVGASTYAQKDNVGIGTTKPDQSAVLDVSSSNKGLLIPRMSLQRRNTIQNPAQGLMVYQSDFISGFYYYDGKEWKNMGANTSQNSVAGVDGDWTLNGNNLSTDIGSPGIANAFIGTVSGGGNILRFKVDGTPSGSIDKGGATFLGYLAGASGTAHYGSVAIGYRALQSTTAAGSNNTAVGYQTLTSNTNGYNNTAIGTNALVLNTGGYNNLALGGSAMETNQSGNENVAVGASALNLNVTGSGNVAIGSSALRKNTVSNNIGIGANALSNNTIGANNFGLGYAALTSNTTGGNNMAIGYQAGTSNISGSGNMFLGFQAGLNETGSDKLYIANSSTANPLIKGDFAASALKVNSKTTGYLAVGDFDAITPMPTPTGYRLIVQDGILTEKIKVALRTSATDWADYVFAKEYKLMPLEQVEQFTKVNKHLPNVPSADEMVKDGLDVSKTSKMFMEKIEELTLYMIEMNKEIKILKAENEKLKK